MLGGTLRGASNNVRRGVLSREANAHVLQVAGGDVLRALLLRFQPEP